MKTVNNNLRVRNNCLISDIYGSYISIVTVLTFVLVSKNSDKNDLLAILTYDPLPHLRCSAIQHLHK